MYFLIFAGAVGIEPTLAVLETAVLPLNDTPNSPIIHKNISKENPRFSGICSNTIYSFLLYEQSLRDTTYKTSEAQFCVELAFCSCESCNLHAYILNIEDELIFR